MKRLNLFILKSFTGPLLLTFFIVTFLLQMQFLWKYIDDLAGKGLSLGIMAELMLFASATFVPLSLPLAVLLASLMAFGSLGENYELTAIKASGISLTKVMKPLIILMVMISISAFFYSNISLPFFNWKMRALLTDIQQQRPELQIKEGVYYNAIENYSIKIGKKDPKTNLLHNIQIYDHSANSGNTNVTLADSGYMMMTADKRNLKITLYSGESYSDMPENERRNYNDKKRYPFRRDKFKKQVINIQLEGFDFQRTEEGFFRTNYQMMNLKQLQMATDSMTRDLKSDASMLKLNLKNSNYYPRVVKHKPDTTKKLPPIASPLKTYNTKALFYLLTTTEKSAAINFALSQARNAKSSISAEVPVKRVKTKRMRRHEVEWHKKFTLSLACLVFFFIGAPLGAIIRKGGLGLPLVISVFFFILYYIITLTGEKMVRESYLPAHIGVWISSMILLPLGAFLTVKATNDSAVLNMDSYTKFLNKIAQTKIWRKITGKEQS